jgi:hypothetical protein
MPSLPLPVHARLAPARWLAAHCMLVSIWLQIHVSRAFQDIVKQKFTFTHHLEISTDEGPMDTYLHGDHAMPVASMGANGARLRDAAIAPALKAPIGAPSILWAHRGRSFPCCNQQQRHAVERFAVQMCPPPWHSKVRQW